MDEFESWFDFEFRPRQHNAHDMIVARMAWLEATRRASKRCAELEAEILRLRAELKGPNGFETWKDAATAELLLRIDADRKAREECAETCSRVAIRVGEAGSIESLYAASAAKQCEAAILATIKDDT